MKENVSWCFFLNTVHITVYCIDFVCVHTYMLPDINKMMKTSND